mgnify:CR=1 FL=1
MMKFKIGDLVRVKEGTDDVAMPNSRMGLIIEEVLPPSQPNRTGFTSIWRIWMTDGSTLKFHEMFLEHVKRKIE